MTTKHRWGPWIRWFLFSEGLIFLMALIGPGVRRRRGDRAMLARRFLEDPSFLDSVVVNALVLNAVVAALLTLARVITRRRRRRGREVLGETP